MKNLHRSIIFIASFFTLLLSVGMPFTLAFADVTPIPTVTGTPAPTSAISNGFTLGGVVPCGNETDPNLAAQSCNLPKFLTLVQNVMTLLFIISIPLATISFVYTGWLLLTSQGSTEKINRAKGIAWNVVIGFIFVLAAWLIVYTIVHVLVKDPSFSVFMSASNGTPTSAK